jgi:hypothetical protein
MNVHFAAVRIVLFCVGVLAFSGVATAAPCAPNARCTEAVAHPYPEGERPSWIFERSTYTHDPHTGARVAQYMRTPPVEPLEDERAVTSRYRRTQTNLRGANGSYDTYYEVQAWGNGRGGIDAEWERFHNAWKESYLQNGYYNQSPSWNGPWNNGRYWNQGGPWQGGPWQGGPWNGNGHPGNNFPGGGWNGGWGQGGNFPPNGPGGP